LAGTRQHRLPAAYIGGFGTGVGPLRERPVWVRRRNGSIHEVRSDNLNFERGAYDTSIFGNPDAVDRLWGYYEEKLRSAIDSMLSGVFIPRERLLEGMIPFIAGLCVRSAEYDNWMQQGTAHIATEIAPDNTNIQRVTDFQQLAGCTLRCQWTIFHAPVGSRFVTNDIGCTGGSYDSGVNFLFVPLRPNAGLELRRQDPEKRVWQRTPGGRMALIGRYSVRQDEVPIINQHIASMARREIYGQTKQDVQEVAFEAQVSSQPKLPGSLIKSYPEDRDNPPDMDWLRELEQARLDVPPLPIVTILDWLDQESPEVGFGR
jgi:hypothetical protein